MTLIELKFLKKATAICKRNIFLCDETSSPILLPVGFIFDLFPDFGKVHELFALAVKKRSIFVAAVDQLENERTPCHDAAATG